MVNGVRGRAVSVGVGAACLGDPHSATLWLAYRMARTAAAAPLSATGPHACNILILLMPVRAYRTL